MTERSPLFGRVSSNVAANMIGRAPALLAFLFVPLFVHYLGAEAYGMVGVYYTLTSLISLADLGISTATTREVAKLVSAGQRTLADFVRAVETIYLLTALAMATVLGLAAPFLAHRWLQASALSPAILTRALLMIGLTIAVQWPFQVYSAVFNGLQEQITPNAISASFSTARPLVLLLALKYIAPTITVFFTGQLLISLLTTATAAWALRRRVAPARGAWLGLGPARPILRFASRLSIAAALGLAFVNVDKVVLSRLAPLTVLGYYTVAFGAASMIALAAQPFFVAAFPRFVELVETGREETLRQQYHLFCQAVAVLALSAGIAGSLFAPALIHAYIRDPLVAGHVQQIFRWIVLANTAAALGVVPYALQLAFGRTRFSAVQSGVSLGLAVPLSIWAVPRWGGVGVAVVLCSIYVVASAVTIPIAHRQLLPHETERWALDSILKPALAVLVVTLAGRSVISRFGGVALPAAIAVAFGAMALAAASLAAPDVREWAFGKVTRRSSGPPGER